jgi:hypothetical protein
MKEEIKKICEQINGKLVKYVETEETNTVIDAILLAPPGGTKVSVKPYGYTPKELADIYIKGGEKTRGRAISAQEKQICFDNVSSKHYCLSTFGIIDNDPEQLEVLRRIANLPEGSEFYYKEITLGYGNVLKNQIDYGNPSCPYA